ncbi:MAG TPA: hypothetical protein PLM72_10185 [Spirochaetota bacterium]|nr:hypothetical protein [Spirochaetota bacterium]HQO23438.1 hypothetical protein [Spirochaetota bacterium]
MIRFFVKSGDTEVDCMFSPYIWSDRGIDAYIKKYINQSNYSKDLDFLLIMFYVEGKFFDQPVENGKVSNYSSKDKSISVAIDVSKDKFHNKNDDERKKYIIESIILSVNIVAGKLQMKKMEFDKNKLLKDLEDKVFRIY